MNPLGSGSMLDINFLGIFYETHVPPNSIVRRESNNWLRAIISVQDYNSDLAVKLSLRALAITRVARLHNDKRLVTQGQLTYGHALRVLQQSLWDPTTMYNKSNLAAARTLLTYELFESDSDSLNGWLSHVSGISRLVYLRRPERFESHGLLEDFRFTEMIHSIMRRRKSYLTSPEWLTMPWKDKEKAAEERVWDHGLLFAAELELFEAATASKDALKLAECLDNCLSLRQGLASCEKCLSNEFPGPFYAQKEEMIQLTACADAEEEPHLRTVYHYSSLRLARALMMTWALQICISELIDGSRRLFRTFSGEKTAAVSLDPTKSSPRITAQSSPSPSAASSTSIPSPFDPSQTAEFTYRLSLAERIVRSAQFTISSSDWGFVGATICLFPLATAWRTMEKLPREGTMIRWVEDLFVRIRKDHGLKFALGLENTRQQFDPAIFQELNV